MRAVQKVLGSTSNSNSPSTALVTGATGMLGRAIVLELAAHPEQWTSIHALSRSKKEKYPPHVTHTHIDLTSPASEMAQSLKDLKPEFVFFAAYLQEDSEEKNAKVNGAMLENFLDAIKLAGINTVKRVVLVTGAKQYGVHLGRVKAPMEERDPWLTGEEWPPNFYYVQQDILKKKAEEHNSWDWVVTYPNDVIGVAHGNFMNLATALCLYALINKELGQELLFPGHPDWYTDFDSYTDAKLHAQFCMWAAHAPSASNQAFNVVNGDVQSWQTMWPDLAEYFGLSVPSDQFTRGSENGTSFELAPRPPVATQGARMGLEGTDMVKQTVIRGQLDLVGWSQRQDVKDAWSRIAQKNGLDEQVFEKATWGFLQFVLGRGYDCVISMSKARKAGWNGYVDTWDALKAVFEELKDEKVIPKS